MTLFMTGGSCLQSAKFWISVKICLIPSSISNVPGQPWCLGVLIYCFLTGKHLGRVVCIPLLWWRRNLAILATRQHGTWAGICRPPVVRDSVLAFRELWFPPYCRFCGNFGSRDKSDSVAAGLISASGEGVRPRQASPLNTSLMWR